VNWRNTLVKDAINNIFKFGRIYLIDGGVFSPMKKLMKIHNGFTKSLKLKMVDDYSVNYKKK